MSSPTPVRGPPSTCPLLKEGAVRASGRNARLANIRIARIIAECVKSSFGPKGMDKMIVDPSGKSTVTNVGGSILFSLDKLVKNPPAAKVILGVADAMEGSVGDGTTSAVILAGALLSQAEHLLQKRVHPTIITEGYTKAMNKSLEFFRDIAVDVDPMDRVLLRKIVKTAMADTTDSNTMNDLVVEAGLRVIRKTDEKYEVDTWNVKIEKETGGSSHGTTLIDAVTVANLGVDPNMPKKLDEAKIALLRFPLKKRKLFEATKTYQYITTQSPQQMKEFVQEEKTILKSMIDRIADLGVNMVVCEKDIDQLAAFYLQKRNILALKNVNPLDVERLEKATGGKSVGVLEDLEPENLGYSPLVEDRLVGASEFTFIEGCRNPKPVTFLIRGSVERALDEVEAQIFDGLSTIRSVMRKPKVVVGGGAAEAEVAFRLRNWTSNLSDKSQLAAVAFSEALEEIPCVLAQNTGLNSLDVLIGLRSLHANGVKWAGVDASSRTVRDMSELGVYEPLQLKEQMVVSACETASMIIRVDDIITVPRIEDPRLKHAWEYEKKYMKDAGIQT